MKRIAELIITIPLLAVACMAHADERPAVTYPINNQEVMTYRLEARGRVPNGTFPFFVVEPMAVSPQTWIQPHVHSVGADGSVTGTINLGSETNGAQQKFKIYLLACKKEDPFGDTKVIQRVPKGCVASAPVEVLRVR